MIYWTLVTISECALTMQDLGFRSMTSGSCRHRYARQGRWRGVGSPARVARSFRLGLGIGLGLCLGLGSGCLIPLPLEQENSVDGGQLLVVTGSMPKFGSQVALMNTTTFTYQIDVISDSASLAGRLYLQVNGSCCDLKIDDSNVTRFRGQAQVTPLSQGNNLYSVEFNNPVVPCSEGLPAGSTVYVVPVLASGGFIPSASPNPVINPDGIGVVDRSHYWTVKCP